MSTTQGQRSERMHVPVWLFALALGLGGGGFGSTILGTKLSEEQVKHAASSGVREALKEYEQRLREVETKVAVLESSKNADMQVIKDTLRAINAAIVKGGT